MDAQLDLRIKPDLLLKILNLTFRNGVGQKKGDHMLSGWLFLGHRFDTDTFSAN